MNPNFKQWLIHQRYLMLWDNGWKSDLHIPWSVVINYSVHKQAQFQVYNVS